MTLQTFIVPEALHGERVDLALSRLASFSRSHAQTLVEAGGVFLDGQSVQRPKEKVQAGEVLSFSELPAMEAPQASQIPLEILFEDDDLLVLNKQAGLVVHPAPGHVGDTLVNALLAHVSKLSTVNPLRPGIVHRLDKDTSGLMLVAKNNAAHVALADQFVPRFDENGQSLKQANRTYQALVFGAPMPASGRIQTRIGRHPRNRQKMAVLPPTSSAGKNAVTLYRVLKTWQRPSLPSVKASPISLVEFHLETGRTHQIRVHSAFMGWPLVGDPLYGNPARSKGWPEAVRNFPRQALHATQLTFLHPKTGESLTFSSPLPEDLQHLVELISLPS